MKILFVYKGSIENESASANRILAITKYFKKNNVDVTIYNVLPTKGKNKYIDKDRVFIIHPPKIKWIPRKLSIIIGLTYLLPKTIFNKKPDIIYSYGFSIIQTYLLLLYKIYFKFILVKELNEYPLYFLTKNKINNLIGFFLKYFDNKGLDCIIVISDFLENYYKRYASKKTKFYKLNMIVDLDRFNISKNYNVDKYILYCGSFNNNKDGILFLIKGFNKYIKNSNETIKLYLIGQGNKKEEKELNELINLYDLKDKVIKLGLVSKNLVPKYIINASALILPRPFSIQAQAGFPTKLGEYLASSNPVIISRVGEVPLYLYDNYNCYLLNEVYDDSICKKIRELIDDPSKSSYIGKNGRLTAEKYFSAEIEVSKLLIFFENLKKNANRNSRSRIW